MAPREFDWRDAEYRGAVPMLVREVGGASILHAVAQFDDRRRALRVEIWWAEGVTEAEKSALLRRCAEELRRWKGLAGYEPAVVSATRPLRPEPPLGSAAYVRGHRRRDAGGLHGDASSRRRGGGRSKG